MTTPLEDRLADALRRYRDRDDISHEAGVMDALAAYDAAKAAPAERRPGEPPVGADDTPDWKLTAKFLQDDLINAKAEARQQRERAESAEQAMVKYMAENNELRAADDKKIEYINEKHLELEAVKDERDELRERAEAAERSLRNRCEHCGAIGIEDCGRCGAPNCCPQCCKIDSLERRAEAAEKALSLACETRNAAVDATLIVCKERDTLLDKVKEYEGRAISERCRRDYFAAMAMQGIMAADHDLDIPYDSVARMAVLQADALDKAMEVTP